MTAGAQIDRLRGRLAADALRFFSGQVAATVAAILAGIVVTRILGPAGKGALGYATAVLTLATTAFSGVTTAAVVAIARHGAARGAVRRATLRTAILAGAAAALVMVALAAVLPVRSALLAAAAAVIPAFLAFAAISLLQYQQRTTSALLVQQIGTTGFSLAAAVVALAGGGLIGVFTTWVAALTISAIAGVRLLTAEEEAPAAGPVRGTIARVGVATTALQVVAYVNFTVDLYIVGALRSPTELGIYALAIASGEMLWQISRSIVWPAIGPLADLPQHDAAALAARLCAQSLWLAIGAAVPAWIIGPWAIRVIYGEAFAPAGEVLRIVLPGIVAMAAESPLGSYVLYQLGSARALLIVQTVATLACAAICVVGLPRYGIAAAAFATSVTYVGAFAATVVLAARGGVAPREALAPPRFGR